MNRMDNFTPPFRLEQWLISPALNRISGPGGEVQIEPRVMRVLLVLAENPGEVVPRLQLLDEVWGDTVVGEEILTRAISELRRVFGDSAREPHFIETIRHHGYRLIAEIRPGPAEADPGREAVTVSDPPDFGVSTAAKPGWRFRSGFVLAAAALVLLAIFGPRLVDTGGPEKDRAGSFGPPSAWPLTSYPGREKYPALSADGTLVAFAWAGPAGDNIDIYVMQRNTETALRVTEDPGWAAWPAWSPDGQTLAFVQGGEFGNRICLIASIGGAVRTLHEVDGWVDGLDWSPDGVHLVYSAPGGAGGHQGLFVLRVADFQVTPLTPERADSAGDFQPRFSPDGRRLAWVGLDQTGRTGLFIARADGGAAAPVAMGLAALQGLAWEPDGRHLVYAAAPAGRFDLWRVPAEGGEARWIPTPGDFAWNPSIARQTGDLVYEEVRADQDLWRIRIVGQDPWQLETGPFIKSTRWEYEADFHPDGSRVVFVSARSGKPELWLADRDGGNLRKLTSLGAGQVSNPRWSPQGDRIAFNAMVGGRSEVMVIEERGGEPLVEVGSPGPKVFTDWCADGVHLLVSVDPGDGWQIFRQDTSGGPGVRLTFSGGLTAQESPTGQDLFFTRPGQAGLWRVDLAEGKPKGEPVLVIPDLLPQDGRNWRLVTLDDAVVRIAWVMRIQESSFLMFLDIDQGESTFLTELPGLAGAGLALAPGGDEIIYARIENMAGDLMLLEGVRP